MKLFTSDYRDGTARLSFELQGFYFRILTLLHDGDSVPSDGKALGVMLQCDPRKAVRLTRQLIAAGKLYEAEGELRNKRIDRDIGLTSGELRGDFDGTSPALQPDIDEKSERKIQKDESNQEGSKPYYGESHFHCHIHSQREEQSSHTELEAAREGELAVGHGVFVNCETIRHRSFTISIPSLELLTGGRFTRDEIKAKAQGHALAWAAEIEGGKRASEVVPAKIGNFLSASLMGDFSRQQCADVRKAKADRQSAKPTVAEVIAKRKAAEAMGAAP